MAQIKDCRELDVYQTAMRAAMLVFELSKGFPAEERFSMVDQMRRSSRCVCGNITEAWRRRRYKRHFISKLSDAESEAEETRGKCQYLSDDQFAQLDDHYDKILGQLGRMFAEPEKWTPR